MRIADAYTHLERSPTSGPTGTSASGPTAGAASPAASGRSEGERARVAGSGFHVRVSPRAMELAARTEAEATRTEELRTSIDAGSFVVDRADIARKIVGSMIGEST